MRRSLLDPDRILYGTRAVRHFADGSVAVLLPIYLTLSGFSAFQVGVLSAASLLGSAALTLAAGWLARQYGVRPVLLGFAALMCATGISLAFLPYTVPLLITAFVGTINPAAGNNSVFVPLEHAALASAVTAERRTMAFATYATSGAIAASFGALSSGAADLMAARGMALTDAIRLLFLGYAALGLVAGLFYLQLPHTPMTAQKRATGALGPSRNRVYGLAALFALDSFASGFAVQSLITVWLVTTHGLSATAAGTFFFWSSILAAATLPLAGWLATRFGLINTMVWTHLPSNVLLIAAAMVPDLTWALVLLLARAVCMTMDTPARASYVMAIVTPEERPAAGSVTNAPRNLAAGISPAIAGALFMAYGGAVPLIVCGVLKIGYDILLLAQFRNVRPPEEQRAP